MPIGEQAQQAIQMLLMKQWYKSKERGRGKSQEGKEYEKPIEGLAMVQIAILFSLPFWQSESSDGSSDTRTFKPSMTCSGFQSAFVNCLANE